jgi:hypothetical protein
LAAILGVVVYLSVTSGDRTMAGEPTAGVSAA